MSDIGVLVKKAVSEYFVGGQTRKKWEEMKPHFKAFDIPIDLVEENRQILMCKYIPNIVTLSAGLVYGAAFIADHFFPFDFVNSISTNVAYAAAGSEFIRLYGSYSMHKSMKILMVAYECAKKAHKTLDIETQEMYDTWEKKD